MYKSNVSTTFCLSKDLKVPFKLKLGYLKLHDLQLGTLFISIQLISSNRPLTTPIVSFINNANNTNKWIEFPIFYSQIPLDTKVFISLYNYTDSGHRHIIGHCLLNLFNTDPDKDETDNYTLKKGYQRLLISLTTDSMKSPVPNNTKHIPRKVSTEEDVMDKLGKKIKLHENGDIASLEWLDNLAFRKIEQINRSSSSNSLSHHRQKKDYLNIELCQFDIPVVFSDVKYSILNIPTAVDNNNSFGNLVNTNETITTPTGTTSSTSTVRATGSMMTLLASVSLLESSTTLTDTYQPIFDPDQYRDYNNDDPIELKFRKLERIHQSSYLDKDIRPTLKVRSKIFEILTKQFFEKLSSQEKNLIWKFRFYLLNNFMSNNSLQFNNFVINFIKCINWDDEFEVNEFLNIINEVQNQHDKGENLFIKELEIVDCLELLSYNYGNPIIRKLAIERLKLAKDEELELYLLQLVQAIKFENDDPENADELNENIINNDDGTLMMNSAHTNNSSEYAFIESTELGTDQHSSSFITSLNNNNNYNNNNNQKLIKLNSPLLNFLIERAINNKRLTSYFYWYVKVECDGEKRRKTQQKQRQQQDTTTTEVDDGNLLLDNHDLTNERNHSSKFIKDDKIFYKTLNNFIVLLTNSQNGAIKIDTLSRQIEIFSKIRDISNQIKNTYKKEPTFKKIELLRKLLSEKHHRKRSHSTNNKNNNNENHNNNTLSNNLHHSNTPQQQQQQQGSESLLQFEPIPLPLDPDVEVCGTIPEECSVFKSSLSPLKITFKTTTTTKSDGNDNNNTDTTISKYPLMYKIGDDLRQDQFVIQIMTLIEKILQNENLDLRLTPYKILALGEVEGLIEFIPNESLSSILSTQGSILNYLQKYNPDPSTPLGVKLEVMDNYVRSCAGYCVITYLLGVGDRHLDNLLLTKDGYFFHADFGYILGEDPKPFPPLMKLPIQIIEGMGGLDNENYKFFCNFCFITYITLRKNSNLILNLFQLMIDSNIPVLQTVNGDELEKTDLILKIKDKFMLELNDEEAIIHFQNLINDSVNAFLPVVIDRLHSFAQYWRA